MFGKIQGFAQGLIGAKPVGVAAMANDRVLGLLLKMDRVDSANGAGHRIDGIEQWHHRDFEGDGDGYANKSKRPKPGKTSAQIRGAHGNIYRVNSHCLEGGIVHDRAQRVFDRVADDAEEAGLAVDHAWVAKRVRRASSRAAES